MKASEIKTTYDLMKYCKMHLYFQRNIRDMKVGDIFLLGICKDVVVDNLYDLMCKLFLRYHH